MRFANFSTCERLKGITAAIHEDRGLWVWALTPHEVAALTRHEVARLAGALLVQTDPCPHMANAWNHACAAVMHRHLNHHYHRHVGTAGHALYEQGRNLEFDGLPVNEVTVVVSLHQCLSMRFLLPAHW